MNDKRYNEYLRNARQNALSGYIGELQTQADNRATYAAMQQHALNQYQNQQRNSIMRTYYIENTDTHTIYLVKTIDKASAESIAKNKLKIKHFHINAKRG